MLKIICVKDNVLYGEVSVREDINALVKQARENGNYGYCAKGTTGKCYDENGKVTEGIVLFDPIKVDEPVVSVEPTYEAPVVEAPAFNRVMLFIAKINQLKEELNNSKVENEHLRGNIESLQARVGRLVEEKDHAETEVLALKEELKSVNAELDELLNAVEL